MVAPHDNKGLSLHTPVWKLICLLQFVLYLHQISYVHIYDIHTGEVLRFYETEERKGLLHVCVCVFNIVNKFLNCNKYNLLKPRGQSYRNLTHQIWFKENTNKNILKEIKGREKNLNILGEPNSWRIIYHKSRSYITPALVCSRWSWWMMPQDQDSFLCTGFPFSQILAGNQKTNHSYCSL